MKEHVEWRFYWELRHHPAERDQRLNDRWGEREIERKEREVKRRKRERWR